MTQAGMAVISDGELDLRKRAGKLRELDECLRQNPDAGGNWYWAYPMGNTRGQPK